MAKRIAIEVECDCCGGTGVYCGMCEPEGVGVVCLGCNGTGCATLEGKEFTGRNRRRGVKTVMCSRGGFLPLGVGPVGTSVTYKEFLAGKMPEPV